jgi:hypothetical protein
MRREEVQGITIPAEDISEVTISASTGSVVWS